jgi:beta-glucosidase/6-phospho-beta-glucosidase/beta-galactosidase
MVKELLDSNYSSMETSYCWVPDHYAACNAFHLKEEFSLAQLDHYRRMLATYHEHGLISMVTFHHFI